MPFLWDEWQWASLSSAAHCGIPGDFPDIFSLTRHGGSAWWISFFPLTSGISIEKTEINPESMEHFLTGDSSKDSKEGTSHGELLCLEALQGATEHNPLSFEVNETPASWEEHLPLADQALRILRC